MARPRIMSLSERLARNGSLQVTPMGDFYDPGEAPGGSVTEVPSRAGNAFPGQTRIINRVINPDPSPIELTLIRANRLDEVQSIDW